MISVPKVSASQAHPPGRAVAEFSGCWVRVCAVSWRTIEQQGISFGSIFSLDSYENSRGRAHSSLGKSPALNDSCRFSKGPITFRARRQILKSKLQSTLSKTDTFGIGTKCPS